MTDALAEDRAALAIALKLVAQLPTVAIYQGALADCHTKIGDILRGQGDAAGALVEYRAALPVVEALARLDPKDADRAKALAALRQKVRER
jgi:Flp pilus assembly protein TadD